MLKYIIIDDEPLAHEIIEEFCSMLPHVQLEKNCYNAMEAMQFLNENMDIAVDVDVAFKLPVGKNMTVSGTLHIDHMIHLQ